MVRVVELLTQLVLQRHYLDLGRLRHGQRKEEAELPWFVLQRNNLLLHP
jgi:hypothetical protein